MPKVFLAIDYFSEFGMSLLQKLEAEGIEVILKHKNRHQPAPNQQHDVLRDIDYIIAGLEPYDADFFANCPKLKCISRVGVGTDNINLEAAKAAGVRICITSDQPSVAVAELCVGNIISLLRNTHEMSRLLKDGDWKPIQGIELRNCSVGIVGLGSIGKELAKRLSVFGCEIKSASRTWNREFAASLGIQQLPLHQIFKECNVVSVHLPLEQNTKGIISEELISSMMTGSILLNTSRAAIVDNVALAKSIKKGLIAGAAIDVFDDEPDIYPYQDLENVILSPHIGSHTKETRHAMEQMAINNVLSVDQFLKGKPGVNVNELLHYLIKVSV